MRQPFATVVEQKRGDVTPRMRRTAQGNRVEMHALEMPRRLVFLGIADGAKGMLGFERNVPQGLAREGNSCVGEIAPVSVTLVVQMRRMIERTSHALKRDEAVGELVLDRLELAYRLPELLTLLGIVDRQFESAPGRTMGTGRQGELSFQQ